MEEIRKLENQKKELIEGNEVQKIAKKKRLQEQAMAEQKEYQDIIKRQIADMEEDRRLEEMRKNIYNSNGEALRKQMKEKKIEDSKKCAKIYIIQMVKLLENR